MMPKFNKFENIDTTDDSAGGDEKIEKMEKEKIPEFNVEEISQETGYPIYSVEIQLGIPISGKGFPETISELWQFVNQNAGRTNIYPVALAKLEQLCLNELEHATTSKQLKDIYNSTHIGGKEKNLVWDKWMEVFKKEVSLISTSEEATEIYKNIPGVSAENLLFAKWREFSKNKIEIENLTTAKEARKAYQNAVPKSEEKTIAEKKWEELFVKEVENLTTVEQAKEFFKNSPNNKMKDLALKKLASFYKKIEN